MRPAKKKDLQRRHQSRDQNKTVLIVCEGEKTEPIYFTDMVRDYGVHGSVEITGECGSAPISVVDHAIDLFNDRPTYDSVYCVFDKDSHVSYAAALAKVAAHRLERKERGKVVHVANFEAIYSVPCFEYWVLLHYSMVTAPIQNYAAALPRIRDLPRLDKYEKGLKGLYERLKHATDAAVNNAERSYLAARQTQSINPLTRIQVLVKDLQALRRR